MPYTSIPARSSLARRCSLCHGSRPVRYALCSFHHSTNHALPPPLFLQLSLVRCQSWPVISSLWLRNIVICLQGSLGSPYVKLSLGGVSILGYKLGFLSLPPVLPLWYKSLLLVSTVPSPPSWFPASTLGSFPGGFHSLRLNFSFLPLWFPVPPLGFQSPLGF